MGSCEHADAVADSPNPESTAESLGLNVKTVEGWRVIEVAGEIDIFTGPALQSSIQAELTSGVEKIIVDLSGVRFMDSSGLSVLIGAARDVGFDSFAVTGSQEPVERVLALTGSEKMFPRFASLAEGIESMRKA